VPILLGTLNPKASVSQAAGFTSGYGRTGITLSPRMDRFESILILLHHHADSFAILFLFSRRPAMKEFSQSESAACLNNTFARPNNLDVWLRPAGGIASPRGPSSRGYGGPAGKSVRANAVQASARNGPSGAATSVRSSIRWGAKVYPQRAGSIRRKSPRVGAPTATER
jgi:hypothetical protein